MGGAIFFAFTPSEFAGMTKTLAADGSIATITWDKETYVPFGAITDTSLFRQFSFVNGDVNDIIFGLADYTLRDWIINYDESKATYILLKATHVTDIPLELERLNEKTDDEFHYFINDHKLAGLFPEGLVMTTENQERFIEYFQGFDDITRNYVILLLRGIIDGTITNIYDNPEYGVYLNHCQFCLYDMNGDGFPELIMETGADSAGYWYTVYSVVGGELVNCGGLSGSHADLYADGFGGIIRYEAQMGVYDISVSTLEGTTLVTQHIADGELDYSKDEDYPTLEAYGYENYNQYLEFTGIPTLMLAPAG